MERIETWLGRFVVTHRWLLLTLSVAVALYAAGGLRLLQFDNNSRIFFSKDNPQLRALEALEATYTKVENVLFVVVPDSGNVFDRQTLAAVEELTELAWKLPYSSRVDSLTNYQHTRATEDDLVVADLVSDPLHLTDGQLASIRKIALSEPLLVNRLVSPSGHVTGVNVNFIKPGKDIGEPAEVAAAARIIAETVTRQYPQLQIRLTGGVMIDNAFGEVSRSDMLTLVPLMFLVLLVMMVFALRSFAGTAATFTVILLSMTTGLGLAGRMGITLSPASVNAPTIILTLAVADSVHLLVTMFQLIRSGTDKHDAIAESLRINLQPVFVTSITTAIGFLTMNFSDAPPFHDLGNIVAMGVTAAFLYSILFLPALMAVIPFRVKKDKNRKSNFFATLADFVVARHRSLFVVMLLIMTGLTAGILKIELNDDFVRYFDHRYEFRRDADFAIENLTGLYIIDWDLKSGEPGGVNNPEYLELVEKFANWFRSRPRVHHVYAVTDIMKRLNRNMHGDDDAWYRLPSDRELAAQYLLLYEMNLPFGLDLNDRLNVDKSSSRMTVNLSSSSSREVRDLEKAGRAWLRENAPESMFTHGTGISVMFSYISERNIKSMLGASTLALVLISMIMIIVLKSFKLGIISLLPNLMPAFMAFGIWGIIIGRIGLAVSVLAAMTLGIVVDDTVHYLTKYKRARKEHNMNAEDAVRYAFTSVGAPIWITTLTLVCGFVVLAFSGFQINFHMGIMTALTITIALVLDFFFLPPILILFEGKK